MSGGYVAVTKTSAFNDTEPLDDIQFYRPKAGFNYSVKNLFQGVRRKPYFMYIVVGFALLFVAILITIIAVSVHRNQATTKTRPSDSYQSYPQKDFGLQFYPEPEDRTVLIDFRPMNHASYKHYFNALNNFLHDYSKTYQENGQKYEFCTANNAPKDKVCKFTTVELGKCRTHHEYGYHEGNPCILLKLKLPNNMRPEPLPKSEVEGVLGNRWSPDHIGVSCKGLAAEDEENIGKTYVHNISNIEYFPSKGFPTYFYRERSIDEFLAPLVMVKFNTIADHHYVGIECTAWLKPIAGTKTEDFTTSFVFHIH